MYAANNRKPTITVTQGVVPSGAGGVPLFQNSSGSGLLLFGYSIMSGFYTQDWFVGQDGYRLQEQKDRRDKEKWGKGRSPTVTSRKGSTANWRLFTFCQHVYLWRIVHLAEKKGTANVITWTQALSWWGLNFGQRTTLGVGLKESFLYLFEGCQGQILYVPIWRGGDPPGCLAPMHNSYIFGSRPVL